MEWAMRHVESLDGRTHVKKSQIRPISQSPSVDNYSVFNYGQDPEWYHLNGNLDSQHIPCP